MVETVSGARGPFTGAHTGPQFSALGVNQTPMEDGSIQCREVCGLNVSDRCDFIRTTPDCHSQGGYLNYLEGIFCHFPPNLLPLAITLYAFWLLYLFLILGVTAAKFFCPNLSAISTVLKLSHNVAVSPSWPSGMARPISSAPWWLSRIRAQPAWPSGRCLVRVCWLPPRWPVASPSCAPSRPPPGPFSETLFSTWWPCTWPSPHSTLAGSHWHGPWRKRSLVYSMPGTPEMLSDSEEEPVSSNSYDYSEEYRPLLFYQETTVQILARALNPLDYRKWRSKSVCWRALKVVKLPVEFLMLLTVPVVDPDKEDGNWKRPLNCLHLVISPLVLILTLQSGAYGVYDIGGLVPVWVIVVIAGTAVAAVTFFATSNSEPPRLHWLFAFLGFLTSALWINAAATEVVNILRSLGVVFRLSNTVLGLTLLAWGNSIGDAFSDFTLARQGYPRMAFSACFGGIILNLLVGVGLGCLLQISRSHVAEVKLEPDGLLVWVLVGALGLSLVCSLVSVPLQCFQLNKVYGFCLLLFYVNFLVVALLTEFGVIHLKSA
uniref:Mitochondrial sodium/calcium exchanger protein isoform X2 n=1 Tax=Callorhinus ursinus TaxID=34884 RepID=A0A3Q7QU27_CALUR|nr:mitochondrial sodium/calcium exchanger protein isoform X2 [Callorhinus ursinus]